MFSQHPFEDGCEQMRKPYTQQFDCSNQKNVYHKSMVYYYPWILASSHQLNDQLFSEIEQMTLKKVTRPDSWVRDRLESHVRPGDLRLPGN